MIQYIIHFPGLKLKFSIAMTLTPSYYLNIDPAVKQIYFSPTIKKCWNFCTIFRCKSHQFSYGTKICSLLRNTFNPWIKTATLTKMSKFFDGWRKNSKYFLMIWEKIVYIIRTKSAYFYSQFCIRSAALRSASQLQILLVKKIFTFNPYNIIYYF